MAEMVPESHVAWQTLGEAQRKMRSEGLAAGVEGLLHAVQGFRRAGDPGAESYALDLLARVHHALGNFREAAQYHQAGLEAARSLDKPGTRIAKHLNGLGMALGNMGRWQEAERVYLQAIEETRKPIRSLRELRARILKHLADVYTRYAGRAEEALVMYDEAISISREYDDKFNVAAALNFKGTALDHLQRPEEAIRMFEEARALAETIGDKGLIASCYAHLAQAYLHLSNKPLARQYVERALELDRECGNKQGTCRDLWLLSGLQEDEDEKGLETLEDAFLIAREIHDVELMVLVLKRLAGLSDLRLQGGRAKEYLEQALEYNRELGDKQAEIEITTALAGHEDRAKLLSRLQEGILAARQEGLRSLEQHFEFLLAQQHEECGDLLEARERYGRAAALLEEMRGGYQAEEHLRAFSQNAAECYERLVEISLQLGKYSEAFVWAERSRARVLHIMRSNHKTRAAVAMSQDERRQYLDVCERIIALDIQAHELVRAGNSVPQALQERLNELLLKETHITLSTRRSSKFPLEDVSLPIIEPEGLMKRLRELPQRVLALSYYVGNSGVYVFCCSSENFSVRELGSRGEAVRELIRRFREEVGVTDLDMRDAALADIAARHLGGVPKSEMSGDYASASRELYDLLLRPLHDEIAAADHVCIIPHGPLHFLPFHALHDGREYLIERRPVSYATSATTLVESLQGANLRLRRALALGDPSSDLASLPHARKEVEEVFEVLGAERCRKEVGVWATRSVVLEAGSQSSENDKDDAWHFAMHAQFVHSAPHLSYLQLAQSDFEDGRLFAYEIARMDQVAPLTILSACRTAMTREARGDELSGLLFSFLAAGAQTVIATLWSVADHSTAELMTEFYRQLDASSSNLAEALRKAQIALLRKPKTSSPYFWAPFALHCNWNPVAMPAEHATVQTSTRSSRPAPTEPSVTVLVREADSHLGRARIERERQSWSLLNDGEKKALREAISVYSEVMRREPDHVRALRQRGIAYYSLSKTDEAEADLLKASRLGEADPVAMAVLGLIYADRKDYRNAVVYLERALQMNPRLQLEYPPHRTYWLRNPLERCRAAITVEGCTQKLAEAPQDSNIYTERGQAYWLLSINGDNYQEHKSRAIADLDRALALDPKNALALVRKTWIESPGTGLSEVYARALEMDPSNAEAHLRLAQSLGKDETQRSIAEIHNALKCDPFIEHAYCHLAQRYLDQGDLRQALEAFEEEIKRDPNCFEAYVYLTQIYAAIGRREDARHSLRESIRTTPHTPYQGGPGVGLADDIVYAIRDLARRMQTALEASRSSLPLTEITSLFSRANALANEGRLHDAAELYTEILRRDPNNARAYAFRGGCYATLKEHEKAIDDLRKATEMNPNNADAWFNLALVYFNQMKYAESRAAMERARLLNPEMVRRKEEEDNKLRKPRAQETPFDLDKAIEAAYRESRIQCAHCGRPLRRPLGTQFVILPIDEERVKQGIPYYCPLCRVNSCYVCAAKDDSTVKCCRCVTEMEAWGEAKQTADVRPTDVTEQGALGSCVACAGSGPLHSGLLCELCYVASAQAVSALNYEGETSVECGQCGARVPVQLAEVFATGAGDLECRGCFATRLARYKHPK